MSPLLGGILRVGNDPTQRCPDVHKNGGAGSHEPTVLNWMHKAVVISRNRRRPVLAEGPQRAERETLPPTDGKAGATCSSHRNIIVRDHRRIDDHVLTELKHRCEGSEDLIPRHFRTAPAKRRDEVARGRAIGAEEVIGSADARRLCTCWIMRRPASCIKTTGLGFARCRRMQVLQSDLSQPVPIRHQWSSRGRSSSGSSPQVLRARRRAILPTAYVRFYLNIFHKFTLQVVFINYLHSFSRVPY